MEACSSVIGSVHETRPFGVPSPLLSASGLPNKSVLPNSEKRVSGSRLTVGSAPGTPVSFQGSQPAAAMWGPILVRMKITLDMISGSGHNHGRPRKTLPAAGVVRSSTEGSRSVPGTSVQSRKMNPLAVIRFVSAAVIQPKSVLSIVQ